MLQWITTHMGGRGGRHLKQHTEAATTPNPIADTTQQETIRTNCNGMSGPIQPFLAAREMVCDTASQTATIPRATTAVEASVCWDKAPQTLAHRTPTIVPNFGTERVFAAHRGGATIPLWTSSWRRTPREWRRKPSWSTGPRPSQGADPLRPVVLLAWTACRSMLLTIRRRLSATTLAFRPMEMLRLSKSVATRRDRIVFAASTRARGVPGFENASVSTWRTHCPRTRASEQAQTSTAKVVLTMRFTRPTALPHDREVAHVSG